MSRITAAPAVCLAPSHNCDRKKVTDLPAYWGLYRHAYDYALQGSIPDCVADAYALAFASLWWESPEDAPSHPSTFNEFREDYEKKFRQTVDTL